VRERQKRSLKKKRAKSPKKKGEAASPVKVPGSTLVKKKVSTGPSRPKNPKNQKNPGSRAEETKAPAPFKTPAPKNTEAKPPTTKTAAPKSSIFKTNPFPPRALDEPLSAKAAVNKMIAEELTKAKSMKSKKKGRPKKKAKK